MSIVLPILFFAVVIGLYAPRITWRTWLIMAAWIMLVILYNLFKS